MAYHGYFRPVVGTTQVLVSTASSSAMPNAFQNNVIRIVATAACNIRIDSTGAPVATASDMALAPNFPETFIVSPGQRLAAIGAATVNVTELT